ncbi:hypothetical protein FRC11_011795 [Ceratobasidium sp. 423]|nr:hypothetical protein FRC11_011795 [Ceratobasidium sp. 423]
MQQCALSHGQVGSLLPPMMHNSPPSHQARHYSLHHSDPMIPNFSQQQQPNTNQQQQSHSHPSGHGLPPSDLTQDMFENQQPAPTRKRGGRGPGKKDVDRPSISVRWEEGDLTERLIQALERPDKQWHAVIAQVGPEHTRVVIGVPKRDLQREIARHLFANDSRYDLEDKRTIEPLAVSVKNKLFKIVNLYQDCERDLGEWLSIINDERDVTTSSDPNLAAAWGRVKEKLPQFFRVRDLIKRTQTSSVATNSIPSGQTSPTRQQNPQVRAPTQAPQVIPTPQTPRHPASGSLGESSSGATRPSAMQGATGHAAANVGLNLSGSHSPVNRNFVPQQQQHGGNIGFPYGMPSNVSQTPHMTHASTQQLQQQQPQQQPQQQQFQQQQSQHHQAQQRLQHPSQHPHQLSIQHRPYASGSGVSGPASASAPSPSFQAPQSILTRSPALPPPAAPSAMAGPSTQRPPSGHARAPSVTRTTGGPSHASPRHSASPSPPPVSPPLSASVIVKFVEAHESRKRKREEDWFALKRMRYEEREKERAEREKQRQHERDMMRLRIELTRASRGEPPEILDGETELEHLGLREAPG